MILVMNCHLSTPAPHQKKKIIKVTFALTCILCCKNAFYFLFEFLLIHILTLRDMKVRTPFDVIREEDDVHYTYLDTTGRPVIVMRKFNLVEQHIQDFEVKYLMQVETIVIVYKL